MVDEEKLDHTPIPDSLEEAIMAYVLSWGVRCSTNRNQQNKASFNAHSRKAYY